MSTSKKFGLSQFALQNIKAQTALSQVCQLYKNKATTAVLEARNSSNQYGGRVSKLIGVKKTLVNQMQGMAQSTRPKIKSHALTQPMGSKYSIYGQTKLFSSVSSLHGRSSSSSGISPALNHRRCLSHDSPARYIVHQQYHQSRNENIARDISQSIKSELMDVDLNTKRLINCSKIRYRNTTAQKEDKQREAKVQKEKSPLTYDPLDGWNHPRAVKTIDAIKLANVDRGFDLDFDIDQQRKPLRRKSRNIRYKDESNVSVNQQFVQPSLQSRKLQAQLGELDGKKTTNHKSSKFIQQQPNDDQMSVAGDDRKLLRSRHEGSEVSRMDEQYYQSKMAGNSMSASQRVLKSRVEDTPDLRNKLQQIKLAKNMTRSVNPFPQSKQASPHRPPAAPKSRAKTMVAKGAAQLRNRPNSESATMLDRHGEHYMSKLVEKPEHSFSSLPYWKKKSSSVNVPFIPSTGQMTQVQMGEKRQSQNQNDESFAPDNLQNAMLMPAEYSKESAVQRLGTFIGKQATSFYQQNLRARY